MKHISPRVLIPTGVALVLIVMLVVLLQMRRPNTQTHSMLAVATATQIVTATPTLTPMVTSVPPAVTPLPTATQTTSSGVQLHKTPTPTIAHPTPTSQPPAATPTPGNPHPAMKISPMQTNALCGTPTQVGVYPSITITNVGGSQLNWSFGYQVPKSGFNVNYDVQVNPTSGSLAPGQSEVVSVTQVGSQGANALSDFQPREHPGPAGVDLAFYDNFDYPFQYPLWITYLCTNLS